VIGSPNLSVPCLASLGNFGHGRNAPLDIIVRGRPTGNADSHGRLPLPLRASAPAGALVLHACDDPSGVLVTAKGYQHLVEDHVVKDGVARLAQQTREQPCLPAVSLDEFPQAVASQRAHGRPQLDPAGPPRGFGGELPGLSGRTRCQVAALIAMAVLRWSGFRTTATAES
jgi:hypothetical protein